MFKTCSLFLFFSTNERKIYVDEELWEVKFSLLMNDVGKDIPSVDGRMLVRGSNIFDILEKAQDRFKNFGFDYATIHGADHGFKKKGE